MASGKPSDPNCSPKHTTLSRSAARYGPGRGGIPLGLGDPQCRLPRQFSTPTCHHTGDRAPAGRSGPPQTDGAEYLAPDDVAERLADHGPSDADQILAGASLFQRV